MKIKLLVINRNKNAQYPIVETFSYYVGADPRRPIAEIKSVMEGASQGGHRVIEEIYEDNAKLPTFSNEIGDVLCDRCGSVKPTGQSCDCFDNHCE
jgi:hypothetical protein